MNAYQKLVEDLTELWEMHPHDFDQFVHKAIETAKKHEPHSFMASVRGAIRSAMRRLGTTQEQWELAADILFKKEEHMAISILKRGYVKVLEALKTAEQRMEATKRIGAGRTVAPDLVIAEVVPAIEGLAKDCTVIAEQMRERFGR